jgi:molybdopterin-biosynthesis enzyme MoeA-like protein
MSKELTPQEIEEQKLADQMEPLFKERFELELRRGNGVTLEKSEYIGDRTRDIEKELSQLKSKVNPSQQP